MPNTPSLEAISDAAEKVARDEIDDHYKRADDYFGNPKEAGYYVKAYCDTQTASLRKQLKELELINAKFELSRIQLRHDLIPVFSLIEACSNNTLSIPIRRVQAEISLSKALALPATKSDLLEEVVAALKFESEREDCFCDEIEMECVPCRAKRLLKRLTHQP